MAISFGLGLSSMENRLVKKVSNKTRARGKAGHHRIKCHGRLCIGPLPVYFCGHYSFGPCTSQLINLICNRLGNMLNDLAEAIRRWTEKN